MDATALTPEETRELAILRGRAYGPQSDIADDAPAAARLAELEDAARRAAHAGGAQRPPAPVAPDPGPHRPVFDAAAPEEIDDVERDPLDEDAEDPAGAERPPSLRDRWGTRLRSVPRQTWVMGGIAVFLVATIVWGVSQVTSPRSDFTLGPSAQVEEIPREFSERGFIDFYGVVGDSLRQHESFRGMTVWSASTNSGGRCLLIFAEEFGLPASCTPSGLDPTLDIPIWPGMPQTIKEDLPTGSIIRFTLHGGDVHVWVRAANATS